MIVLANNWGTVAVLIKAMDADNDPPSAFLNWSAAVDMFVVLILGPAARKKAIVLVDRAFPRPLSKVSVPVDTACAFTRLPWAPKNPIYDVERLFVLILFPTARLKDVVPVDTDCAASTVPLAFENPRPDVDRVIAFTLVPEANWKVVVPEERVCTDRLCAIPSPMRRSRIYPIPEDIVLVLIDSAAV